MVVLSECFSVFGVVFRSPSSETDETDERSHAVPLCIETWDTGRAWINGMVCVWACVNICSSLICERYG